MWLRFLTERLDHLYSCLLFFDSSRSSLFFFLFPWDQDQSVVSGFGMSDRESLPNSQDLAFSLDLLFPFSASGSLCFRVFTSDKSMAE